MVDWIAVLRAAANRLASVGAESAASAGVALLHALDAAADELERQRDAAQGAATVPDTSAHEGAQEDRCAQPPPASSTRDEIATLLWDHVAVMPGRYGWLNAADAVLAMEAGWRKEIEYLRAQLAEREAELAALRSSDREQTIREVCRVWGEGGDVTILMDHLAAHERARRAKEKL